MQSLKDILQREKVVDLKLPSYKGEGININFLPEERLVEDEVRATYEGGAEAPPLPLAASELCTATVRGAAVLCAPRHDFKPVYQLSLDVKGSTISNDFKPGDTVGVIPKNRTEDVDFLLERLSSRRNGDVPYVLENIQSGGKSQIPKHIPAKSTLRYTLTHCVELRAIVKKLFLLALSKFTTNDAEKRCLELLCSKEGSDLYRRHVLNKNISLLDILRSFPSCSPPAPCILSHLPRLLPRPYSVINSPLKDKSVISICFSVNTPEKGLTTEWLQQIVMEHIRTGKKYTNGDLEKAFDNLNLEQATDGVNIPIYLRKNLGFTFPNLTERVLMVGPGSGVAPYIGFLEERKISKERDSTLDLGETWLFYGCRNPEVDYIYKDELQAYLDYNILSRLSPSFSRIHNNGIKYVQDAIKANGREVAEFLEKGAFVMVCGDLTAMARQTEEAFALCLQEHTVRTHGEAVAFLKDMQKNHKYLVDVWS